MPAETTTPPPVPRSAVPAEAVTPLIRGVGVLRELTEAGGTLSLSGLERATGLARSTVDGIRFIHQATRRRAMSLSFRIGDLLPAERTAPGPLFASEWTDGDWRTWRERRAADPENRGFPAVPPRELPFSEGEFEAKAAQV